jgi:uncharacterized protein YjgD (DUF1641 family)
MIAGCRLRFPRRTENLDCRLIDLSIYVDMFIIRHPGLRFSVWRSQNSRPFVVLINVVKTRPNNLSTLWRLDESGAVAPMTNTTESPLDAMSLLDRLNDPRTAATLHALLDQAETIERAIRMASELPNLVAIATDLFDAVCQNASQDGINIEQRATRLVKLIVQVTEPETMRAIESLVARLPKLAQGSALLDELPNLAAIAIDVFDEWATQLKEEGIELEQSLRQGLHAALYLGGQVRKEELDRIGFLLKSDVMSENSVATVGMAGSALSSCHRGTCEHPVPKRVGLFGLLAAIRDPNTQRALSFGLQFAKCFGGVLDEHHIGHPKSSTSTRQG